MEVGSNLQRILHTSNANSGSQFQNPSNKEGKKTSPRQCLCYRVLSLFPEKITRNHDISSHTPLLPKAHKYLTACRHGQLTY